MAGCLKKLTLYTVSFMTERTLRGTTPGTAATGTAPRTVLIIVTAALGPVIGGLLVTASWRWVFLINVPIGITALVAGWRLLPPIPGHATDRPDPIGVILATAGVAVLTFGLVKGSDWGWGSASVGGTLAAAAVLIALFVLHCLRAPNPLIDPSLFRSRGFTGASLVALLDAFRHGWWVIAALSFVSIVPALTLLRRQRAAAPARAETGS